MTQDRESPRDRDGARRRVPALVFGAVSVVACSPPPIPVHAPGPSPRLARYDVEVDDGGGTLLVHMRLAPGAPTQFELEEGAERFASELSVKTPAGRDSDAKWSGSTLVAKACVDGCAISYKFDLGGAARAFDDPDTAQKRSGAFLSPPSTWLLHPGEPPSDARFEMAVRSSGAGAAFVSGCSASRGVYEGTWEDLNEPPYAALGDMRDLVVPVGNRHVHAVVVGPHPDVGDEGIRRWISNAAQNLGAIYGDYPHGEPLVIVVVEPGSGIDHGSAMGNGGASILVEVGQATEQAAFDDDWILTHEMIHLTLPGLARAHHWAEEGMATYLEPIARARRGIIPVERVWREWIESMPQGLPFADDRGLDATPTWGRTYWGGAVFWFLADVEIRERTDGRASIEDAFRAIHAEGDISVRWPMSRIVAVADRATGTDVVSKLYAAHAHTPVKVDLDGVFARLGVTLRHGSVVYDGEAPLARVRENLVVPAH